MCGGHARQIGLLGRSTDATLQPLLELRSRLAQSGTVLAHPSPVEGGGAYPRKSSQSWYISG